MAQNLRDKGYPASHIDPPFKSRRVNYASGEASVKRTDPTNAYMRGEFFDLDDNHQQEYVNTLLEKVNSPLNVKRWNSRLNINIPWQDTIQKGYSLNVGDTQLARAERRQDPYRKETDYTAAVNNLDPIFGDGFSEKEIQTPLGTLYGGYEDGTAALSYTTPGLKERLYYINALTNLLRGR